MRGLIQWAVSSAALILIVLAVRYLFRNKLSARLRYALWGVVLLRLLVPFQVELPAPVSDSVPLLVSNSVPELPSALDRPLSPDTAATFTQIPAEYLEDKQPNGEPVFSFTAADLQVYDPENDCLLVYRNGFTLGDMAVTLWLAGAGLTGTVILLSNLRFTLRLRKRRERLERIDAPVPVYVAEGLPSPCLFGVFRPAVYLTPRAAEDPDTLRHVLAHELTHHAHFDHLWSLLRCLALALHWYDPLVWLAVVLSKQDGELACDEGAVARLGEEERIPYGRTLVDMVAARSLRPGDLLSCSTAMTGGRRSVKQRVAQIVRKPETVKTALFAVIALVALAVVFVFTGRGEQRPDLYRPYRYQVGRTQAVRYSPSPLSSQAYPDAITDPDLLEKALDILDHAADLLNTPEELDLDLSDAPFVSPRVTLLEDPSDNSDGHTYLLYTHRLGRNLEQCYLVTPAEIGAESYAVAAVLDASAPGALELLARQQCSRSTQEALHTLDRGNSAFQTEGLSFLDLVPGAEQVREEAFIVSENLSSISYSLTYDSPILTLVFGLRAADGTEYSQETYGGVANGTFEGIPAGSYQIFVRNMGDLNDYTQFPTYQPESGRDNATGAVNFRITE